MSDLVLPAATIPEAYKDKFALWFYAGIVAKAGETPTQTFERYQKQWLKTVCARGKRKLENVIDIGL